MDIQFHTKLTELTDIISHDGTLSVISVASVCPFYPTQKLTELTDIISFDATLSVVSVVSVCLFRTR